MTENSFPAVDVERELNPALNDDFKVDPVSSEVAVTSNQIKQEYEAAVKKGEEKKDNNLQSFKTAIILSGVVVAVAGALFAITKKLREQK